VVGETAGACGVHHVVMRIPDALTLLAVVAVVAAVAVAWARFRRPRSGRDLDREVFDDEERRLLDDALAAVEREHGASVQRRLADRVAVLRLRRVPLRAIRSAGEPPVVRLCFADGTVIRARTERPGDWAPVVLALSGGGHGVLVGSYTEGVAHVDVVLVDGHGLSCRATALGLDAWP
jgi:hypothetical protein